MSGGITETAQDDAPRSGWHVPRRFEVLDALRGICACGVVFYHFHTTGIITNSDFARGSWMFVDFFFVLSGFVIYASYGQRLRDGYSIGRFMGLRLGRVYPAYFAMLVAFGLFDVLLAAMPSLSARDAFTGRMDWDLGLLNLTLTQIFGFVDALGWNGPGWSIAAEVWAYLLLSLVLRIFARNPWPVVGLIAAVSVLILLANGDPWLDRTFVHSLPRCLFGFCMGMALYRFGLRGRAMGAITQGTPKAWRIPATLAEAALITLSIAMVSFGEGPATLIAPVVFAAAIWVFAHEGGAFSRLLGRGIFPLLGLWSYSIYIVHVFVQARFRDVLDLADRFGMPWSIEQTANGAQRVTGPWWLADLLTIAMLGAVLVAAWLSYRLIEAPGRRWSRSVFRKSA